MCNRRLTRAGQRIAALVLAVAVTGPATAWAQDGPEIGVKGGVNFASMVARVSFLGESATETSPTRTGVTAGLFVRQRLTSMFAVQIEALFTQRGTGDDGGGLNYFEVPALVAVPLLSDRAGSVRVSAIAGITVGVRLTDVVPVPIDDFDVPLPSGDLLRRTDAGLTVGGMVARNKLTIDFRYTHGLTNVLTPELVALITDVLEEFGESVIGLDFTMKHRAVAVTVGYRFK